MELIIRFDENSATDLQRAQEVIDRLMGRDRDPLERSREQLWQVFNTGIDQLPNAVFRARSLPQLWSRAIHRIGQFVLMTEPQLREVFPTRWGVTRDHLNAVLAEFDPRLHLFMTQDEVLGWSKP